MHCIHTECFQYHLGDLPALPACTNLHLDLMPCSHLHSQLWNGPHCMINMAALTFMQCSACYFLFPASPNPLLSLTAHYGQIGYDLQCKSSHSSPSNMGHFESLGACSEDQNVQNVADRYEAYRMDTSWLFYTGHLYVWLSDCPVILSQTLLARKGSYPKLLTICLVAVSLPCWNQTSMTIPFDPLIYMELSWCLHKNTRPRQLT